MRNVPRTLRALEEAHRVLKVGGRLSILEFSKVVDPLFRQVYEAYSQVLIPRMGQLIAKDS